MLGVLNASSTMHQDIATGVCTYFHGLALEWYIRNGGRTRGEYIFIIRPSDRIAEHISFGSYWCRNVKRQNVIVRPANAD